MSILAVIFISLYWIIIVEVLDNYKKISNFISNAGELGRY